MDMNKIDKHTKEIFWIRLYFNPEKEHFHKDKIIISAIRRAYRDMNRTLRMNNNKDVHEMNGREVNKKLAEEYLEHALPMLYNTEYNNQYQYDNRHNETCLGLMNVFKMKYGQAQKWVNMSIKYLVLLGEDWVTGIDGNIHLYHPPFDNIVLNEMMGECSKGIARPWSKWNEKEYIMALEMFRSMPTVDTPLISEFKFFNKEEENG
jgi:hypothetical protein